MDLEKKNALPEQEETVSAEEMAVQEPEEEAVLTEAAFDGEEVLEETEEDSEEEYEEDSEEDFEEDSEEEAEEELDFDTLAFGEKADKKAKKKEKAPKPEKKKGKGLPVWATICISVLSVAVIVLGTLFAMDYYKNKSPFKSYTGSEKKLIAAQNKVVATAGEYELTNAELQVYYWISVYSFLEENSYYLSYLGLDYTQDLATQQCYFDETKSWQEYFIGGALSAWHQYIVLYDAAKNEGFKLSEDEQEYLDSLKTTMDEQAKNYGFQDGADMVKSEMGAGATWDAYAKYSNETFMGMGYYNSFAENLEVTEDEILAYYENNKQLFDDNGITKEETDRAWSGVRHILITPVTEDADGNTIETETAWATALEKAEDILALYKKNANGKIDEDAFAALVKDNTDDTGSKDNGGLYEQFFEGEMVEEFEAWSFDADRQYGDTDIVKTTYGYHIMFYVGGEAAWRYYSDASIRSEKCTELLDGLKEATPLETNYKNVLIGQVDLG